MRVFNANHKWGGIVAHVAINVIRTGIGAVGAQRRASGQAGVGSSGGVEGGHLRSGTRSI